MKKFHSCFIIDVSVTGTEATIVDSMRREWHIDMANPIIREEFKQWLNRIFLKGIAQTLTVFEYETRGEEPDADDWIVKFHGHVSQIQQLNG